ncbi:HNH endonuclease [Ramlibacter sp. AN1015]
MALAQARQADYLKAHHHVPMSREEDFHSLDGEENIVALCPNCHGKRT